MRLFRGWLLGALLAVVPVVPAHAAEPTISAETKRHVEAGVAHYEAARYEEAVREFELAYRLSNRPALLFNIARAEAKAGHHEVAIAFLRRYLEEQPDAPDASAVLAEVEALEQAVANAKAKTAAEAEAAQAKRQAAALAQQAAQAPAPAPAVTPAPVVTPAPAALSPRMRTLRQAGYGLLGGGAGLGAIGIGLGGGAISAEGEVMNGMGAFSDYQATERRGRLLAPIGIAFDVLGGVGLITGAVLVGVSYTRHR